MSSDPNNLTKAYSFGAIMQIYEADASGARLREAGMAFELPCARSHNEGYGCSKFPHNLRGVSGEAMATPIFGPGAELGRLRKNCATARNACGTRVFARWAAAAVI